MTTSLPPRTHPPQAFVSSYAPRLRTCVNSLLTPVQQVAQVAQVRTTKRGTTAINYSEEFEDNDDDSEAPRRLTGLRSSRNDQGPEKAAQPRSLVKEVYEPVDVQAIWRDWMGKPKRQMTEKQVQIQSHLPLHLVPITIDLTIPPFQPEAALPRPPNAREMGLDDNHPAYRLTEATPEYRLKDYFLWNLHEAMTTPDQFAKVFVDELDFPATRKLEMITQITQQIRSQLEEHATVELHPVFQKSKNTATGNILNAAALSLQRNQEHSMTPLKANGAGTSWLGRSSEIATPQGTSVVPNPNDVVVTAERVQDDGDNPDDASRCVISLSLNIQNSLMTDKFEWSLQHPPGTAEAFAKQTCADLCLSGEWIPALAHAIYEAVIKLKKEVAENSGSLAGVVGSGINAWGEIENDVAEVHGDGTLALPEGAGWRFDNEHLGDEWEPRIEVLSKDEIEKREGDRERQLRRMRRETAHRASIMPQSGIGGEFNSFTAPDDERMGRGERAKRKRRFKSVSPSGRNSPDPNAGGGDSKLTDQERSQWTCSHCRVWGSAVWCVKDGPQKARSLCPACGTYFERHRALPPWSKSLFAQERSTTTIRTVEPQASYNHSHQYQRQISESATPMAAQAQPQNNSNGSYFSGQASASRPSFKLVDPQIATREHQVNPDYHGRTSREVIAQLPEQYAATLRGGGPKMFDDYAIEGEDLDWTKVTDLRERKRLQNIINGRKYRERRFAAEAAEGAARQAGFVGTPGGGSQAGGSQAGDSQMT